MLINVERVNQTESHKWVWHIFKNTYGTYFISKRSWLFLIHSMLPLNRFIIKLLPRSLGTPFVPLKYDLETYGISGNLFDRFLLKNWIQIIKHVPCVFLKIWRTHCALCLPWKYLCGTLLWDSVWLTLSTSISMTLRPLTYLELFSIHFSRKVGYKSSGFRIRIRTDPHVFALVGSGSA